MNDQSSTQPPTSAQEQQQPLFGGGITTSPISGRNPYNNNSSTNGTWFVGTPVSRFIITCMIILYIIVRNVGSGYNSSYSRTNSYEHIEMNPLHYNNYYRYITSKCTFYNNHELMIGISLLSYLLQKYEREMSSQKFISFLCITTTISIFLEYILLQLSSLIPSILFSYRHIQYIGPYTIIGTLFTLFHKYSPRLYPKLINISHMNIQFSEKSFYYIWFLYYIISSTNSNNTNNDSNNTAYFLTSYYNTIAPTIIGIISCIIYLSSLTLQNLNIIPNWSIRLWITIGYQLSLHYTPPLLVPIMIGNNIMLHNIAITPIPTPINNQHNRGNTQLHRRQQRGGNSNGLNGGQQQQPTPRNRQQVGQQQQRQLSEQQQQAQMLQQQQLINQSLFDNNNTNDNNFGIPVIEPDPDAIEQLTAMGFERQQVIVALKSTQNNVEHAADRLLLSLSSSS